MSFLCATSLKDSRSTALLILKGMGFAMLPVGGIVLMSVYGPDLLLLFGDIKTLITQHNSSATPLLWMTWGSGFFAVLLFFCAVNYEARCSVFLKVAGTVAIYTSMVLSLLLFVLFRNYPLSILCHSYGPYSALVHRLLLGGFVFSSLVGMLLVFP